MKVICVFLASDRSESRIGFRYDLSGVLVEVWATLGEFQHTLLEDSKASGEQGCCLPTRRNRD
jgi:6-pyruvoyl-tetrahydropterin synthase